MAKGKDPHKDDRLRIESDSQDEIDREVLNQMIAEAQSCYNNGDKLKATKFYRSAVRLADEIDLSIRTPEEYNLIFLDLAFILNAFSREDDAKEVLHQLLAKYDTDSYLR